MARVWLRETNSLTVKRSALDRLWDKCCCGIWIVRLDSYPSSYPHRLLSFHPGHRLQTSRLTPFFSLWLHVAVSCVRSYTENRFNRIVYGIKRKCWLFAWCQREIIFLPSIALGGQALRLKGLGGENGQCDLQPKMFTEPRLQCYLYMHRPTEGFTKPLLMRLSLLYPYWWGLYGELTEDSAPI